MTILASRTYVRLDNDLVLGDGTRREWLAAWWDEVEGRPRVAIMTLGVAQ